MPILPWRRGGIEALQALGLNGISYATYSQIANQKTWDLMLAAAKREKEGWIDSKSAEKFSCEDLRMIDREWLAASGGQFGFSVQLAIYKQTGNPIGDYNRNTGDRFGDADGGRDN
ncbi:MAG: GUN4 domain-containing protein [Microcystis sp.]